MCVVIAYCVFNAGTRRNGVRGEENTRRTGKCSERIERFVHGFFDSDLKQFLATVVRYNSGCQMESPRPHAAMNQWEM